MSQGRVRSAHIGINYTGTKNALNGCINDARNMLACVREMSSRAGYAEAKTLMITDDTEVKPTRRGILDAMMWLVEGARPGDVLFFSYSGHGTSVADDNGDEADGKDEAFVTLDHKLVRDDEVKSVLCGDLPAGVTLYVIADCCHSGTICDLSFVYDENNRRWVQDTYKTMVRANVWLLSGCTPDQTSADLGANMRVDGQVLEESVGALSNALLSVITRGYTWADLVTEVRRKMTVSRLTQIPQFECGNDTQHFEDVAFAMLYPPADRGAPKVPPPAAKLPPVSNPRISALQNLPLGPYAGQAVYYAATIARNVLQGDMGNKVGCCLNLVKGIMGGGGNGSRGTDGSASPSMFDQLAKQFFQGAGKFDQSNLRFGLGQSGNGNRGIDMDMGSADGSWRGGDRGTAGSSYESNSGYETDESSASSSSASSSST